MQMGDGWQFIMPIAVPIYLAIGDRLTARLPGIGDIVGLGSAHFARVQRRGTWVRHVSCLLVNRCRSNATDPLLYSLAPLPP